MRKDKELYELMLECLWMVYSKYDLHGVKQTLYGNNDITISESVRMSKLIKNLNLPKRDLLSKWSVDEVKVVENKIRMKI